ncbi:MAG: hypothetical protein MZV63_58265 [Marinilabiliales bacterium]|nr:hypothetical protein [Marinilabiliales bacterium]
MAGSVGSEPEAFGGISFEVEITTDTDYSFSGAEQLNGKELLKVTYTGEMHMKGKGTQMGMEMYLEGAGKTGGFSVLILLRMLLFPRQTLLSWRSMCRLPVLRT